MSSFRRAAPGLSPSAIKGLRWRLIDAKDQVVGRLASQISVVLQGKDKPTYAPNRDDGDICVVINTRDAVLTGRKATDKIYYWHTGFIGGIKERTAKDQMRRDETEVLRKAVHRMLPRNRLRDDRMRKLRLFPGASHPFADQPLHAFEPPERNVREFRPREKRALRRKQGSTSEGQQLSREQ